MPISKIVFYIVGNFVLISKVLAKIPFYDEKKLKQMQSKTAAKN